MKCSTMICGSCVRATRKLDRRTKVIPSVETIDERKEKDLRKITVIKRRLSKDTVNLDVDLNALNHRKQNLNVEMAEKREEKLKKDEFFQNLTLLANSLQDSNCDADVKNATSKLQTFLNENDLDFEPQFIMNKEQATQLSIYDFNEKNIYVTKNYDDDNKRLSKIILQDDVVTFSRWKNNGPNEPYQVVKFLDFLHSKTTICNTKEFFRKNKVVLHNPNRSTIQVKFAKIETNEEGQVRIHSFHDLNFEEFAIDFENLMETIGWNSPLPTHVFMKVNREETTLGEVIIETDFAPRGVNFLCYISGLTGRTYRGTVFTDFESFVRGGFIVESGNKVYHGSVVEGICDEGMNEDKKTRGLVCGLNQRWNCSLSQFNIVKSDVSIWAAHFATVRSGFKVIDDIRYGDFVKECGFILQLR